jgi:hypothetical protein
VASSSIISYESRLTHVPNYGSGLLFRIKWVTQKVVVPQHFHSLNDSHLIARKIVINVLVSRGGEFYITVFWVMTPYNHNAPSITRAERYGSTLIMKTAGFCETLVTPAKLYRSRTQNTTIWKVIMDIVVFQSVVKCPKARMVKSPTNPKYSFKH